MTFVISRESLARQVMFSGFSEVVNNCGKDKNYSVFPIIPGMHCTKGTFIIKQTQVKRILIIFIFSLLLTSPLFGQNTFQKANNFNSRK